MQIKSTQQHINWRATRLNLHLQLQFQIQLLLGLELWLGVGSEVLNCILLVSLSARAPNAVETKTKCLQNLEEKGGVARSGRQEAIKAGDGNCRFRCKHFAPKRRRCISRSCPILNLNLISISIHLVFSSELGLQCRRWLPSTRMRNGHQSSDFATDWLLDLMTGEQVGKTLQGG